MIKRVNSMLLFVSALFSHVAYCQSPWILRKEKDGIFIYELKTDTAKFNSIKVETELPGKVEDLVSILLDVGNHYKWAYGTKSAVVLKRISEREIIFYKELKSPGFVVSDRDLVIRLKVIPNPVTKSIKVESSAVPNFVPPKDNLVRVPLSNETWLITAAPEHKIKISYSLQFDPGGALPPVLVNLFISKGPLESFTNLKEVLKKQTSP